MTANTDDIVYAMALSGSTLVIGGTFFRMGGVVRAFVGAVNAATGTVLPWNPILNDQVLGVAILENTVYLSGYFSQISGSVRNKAAAVSLTDGSVFPWRPGFDWPPVTILPTASSVYLGGYFFSFTDPDGGTHNQGFVAAFDTDAGWPLPWNTSLYNYVYSLQLSADDSAIFVGGLQGVHSVDPITGLPKGGWSPSNDWPINSLSVSGSEVYVGGGFAGYNGYSRSGAAAVNAVSGSVLSWNPEATGDVIALAANGSVVYLGGTFTAVGGGQPRINAAAIDAVTGNVLPWNPSPNAPVTAIATQGSEVYLGGAFTAVNGVGRHYAAAVDPTTGIPSQWDPELNGPVNAIAPARSAIYLGGLFLGVDGGARQPFAAAVDLDGGALLPWAPALNGPVSAMAIAGPVVYLGGAFTTDAGASVSAVAVDSVSGTQLPWDPHVSGTVFALQAAGAAVYLGGNFMSDAGVPRFAAKVDHVSAQALPWDAGLSGPLLALAVSGPIDYLGGSFWQYPGQNEEAVDDNSGMVQSTYLPSGTVRALLVDCEHQQLVMGGDFRTVNGVLQEGVAIAPAGAACPVPPAVTTLPATLVSSTQAQLNAWVVPNGGPTNGWFRIVSGDAGVCDDTVGTRIPSGGAVALAGENAAAVSQYISGLTPASQYSFCAIASNDAGIQLGDIQTFVTLSVAPVDAGQAADAGSVLDGGMGPDGGPNPPEGSDAGDVSTGHTGCGCQQTSAMDLWLAFVAFGAMYACRRGSPERRQPLT